MPDHDAAPVGDLPGDVPVAGFFAAGELGPVASKNFLHGRTGSMVLLAHADWVLRRRDWLSAAPVIDDPRQVDLD